MGLNNSILNDCLRPNGPKGERKKTAKGGRGRAACKGAVLESKEKRSKLILSYSKSHARTGVYVYTLFSPPHTSFQIDQLDGEDGVYRASSSANVILYVGLGMIAIGLVITFVGLGDKGFRSGCIRLFQTKGQI